MEKHHRFHPLIITHAREMRHHKHPRKPLSGVQCGTDSSGTSSGASTRLIGFSLISIAETKLLIAVDGASHLEPEQQEYNKLRTEYLEELGYKVIRFTNDDVKFNIQGVTGEILQTVESRIIELKVNK